MTALIPTPYTVHCANEIFGNSKPTSFADNRLIKNLKLPLHPQWSN